jgi:CelD/BcsL family acetyltransferase involved in cellulose biosynthesis
VKNGKANIYKVAYDEAYKKYGPGTLLTAVLMEQVIDRDHVIEVDFLIGDDTYKKIWMSHRRERWGVISYNLGTVRGLLGLCGESGIRLAKKILQRVINYLPKIEWSKLFR